MSEPIPHVQIVLKLPADSARSVVDFIEGMYDGATAQFYQAFADPVEAFRVMDALVCLSGTLEDAGIRPGQSAGPKP